MKITQDGEWTRYEGMRWELEDEFPHLIHLLGSSDEPEELQTPDDWCLLDIYSSSTFAEGVPSELDDILEEGPR